MYVWMALFWLCMYAIEQLGHLLLSLCWRSLHSPICVVMSLICCYFHCPTVNQWPQLYYVVLAQPFHSSLFSVYHSPSTVAPILSSFPFNSSSPWDWASFLFHAGSLGPSLCIVHYSFQPSPPYCILVMIWSLFCFIPLPLYNISLPISFPPNS